MKGNITVGGNFNPDLSGLNRDTDKAQEITKDMITGALDGTVTIDNRVFTEKGIDDIGKQHGELLGNLGGIATQLGNMASKPVETVGNVFVETGEALKGVANTAAEAARDAAKAVGDAAVWVADKATDAAVWVADQAVTAAKAVADAAVYVAENAVAAVVYVAEQASEAYNSTLDLFKNDGINDSMVSDNNTSEPKEITKLNITLKGDASGELDVSKLTDGKKPEEQKAIKDQLELLGKMDSEKSIVENLKELAKDNQKIQEAIANGADDYTLLTMLAPDLYKALGEYTNFPLDDLANTVGVKITIPEGKDPNPVPGNELRTLANKGCLSDNCGDVGATRKRNGVYVKGAHEGTDILAEPGTPIMAPITGTIEIRRANSGLPIVAIVSEDGTKYDLMYTVPRSDLEPGVEVKRGETVGNADRLSKVEEYKNTANHIHVEKIVNKEKVNPAKSINFPNQPDKK